MFIIAGEKYSYKNLGMILGRILLILWCTPVKKNMKKCNDKFRLNKHTIISTDVGVKA